jgi:hypothetical protein
MGMGTGLGCQRLNLVPIPFHHQEDSGAFRCPVLPIIEITSNESLHRNQNTD